MKTEMTRKRTEGTNVTMSNGDTAIKISAMRDIIANHQYAKIDGLMVDGYSASAIIQVYDALNGENREKFSSLPITKMADIAFKLCK